MIERLFFNKYIFHHIAKILKLTASSGIGSEECLKHGYLPVPVHYYSPIPDIEDLKQRDVWSKRSSLAGIEFNEDAQTELLSKLGEHYSSECKWPTIPTQNQAEFYLNNTSFSYGCAASTHSIIREYKPASIIEVGSGNSSKIISEAIRKNREKDERECKYTIIDPYPADYVKTQKIKYDNLINKRVELIDPAIFKQLKRNDILFIDSGHQVRIGSDVNFLYLDVLPILNPGVIIHIHDISMPYEYSQIYATNPSFRQFWTEQYLLQCFLCFNKEFEVLLGLHYLMVDQYELFKKAFPFNNDEKVISGSFWIRRK